jgi:flavin-dependent dehydrogenase
MRDAHILIAGGSIGGLTAALALTQRGFEVSVYEQATGLREFGAGVTITPNGARVMMEFGLRPLIEEIAWSPMILARCLEASDTITEVLQRCEATRVERTSRIVHSSYERITRLGNELADPVQVQAFIDR